MEKLSIGKTTFHCRNCQAVTIVKNEDLETMTGFRCGNCGVPMSTARFAKLKITYYLYLYKKLTSPPFGGEGPEMFKAEMDFIPYHERD